MQAILRLDMAGQPRGWITLHEAVSAYAKGDVIWGIGDALPPVFGGMQRLTGLRSRIDLQPIIAIQGKIVQSFTPPLCNRTLFRRDDHHCMYCGQSFSRSELTRDHVYPSSRGGKTTWLNITTACKPCNVKKADARTPEEAGLKLLAIPYEPSYAEYLILSNHRILGDQMEFLKKGVKKKRSLS